MFAICHVGVLPHQHVCWRVRRWGEQGLRKCGDSVAMAFDMWSIVEAVTVTTPRVAATKQQQKQQQHYKPSIILSHSELFRGAWFTLK